jgi:hypothetical protein
MLFSILLAVGLIVTVASAIVVTPLLHSGASISMRGFAVTKAALLWIAGILSGMMMLISLAAAAWGMDTRLPWGIGIYMYVIPALSLPAFVLLKFSVRQLSGVLWLLTSFNSFAWFFGGRAERIASGGKVLSGPLPTAGMILNGFTLLYLVISALVQLAALCQPKGEAQMASTVE